MLHGLTDLMANYTAIQMMRAIVVCYQKRQAIFDLLTIFGLFFNANNFRHLISKKKWQTKIFSYAFKYKNNLMLYTMLLKLFYMA